MSIGVIVNIHLSRPKGFSDGVYRVEVKIADSRVIQSCIGFEVPVVAGWFFRPTERREFYMAPLRDSASHMRGVITNGEWECIVQSNGISEEENPISRKALECILNQAIETAILTFQQ
jgi:hypothetical protein